MAIPTWRNMAAPKLSTEDISRANANSVAAMDKILKGFTDLDDTSGDIMKTQATNALSNVIPNAGESRAAARERFVQANPDAFSSSYLDADVMSDIKTSLSALDAGKKKIDDENIIMGEVEQLEGINPMENPAEARTALNNIHTQNRLNNVSDSDNRLKYYSDQLLRGTKFELTEQTLIDAGGVLNDERSYTPEVIANVRQSIEDKIRKDNLGASDEQIKLKVSEILSKSPLQAAFKRQQTAEGGKTLLDYERQNLAKGIANAYATGNNDELIKAVRKGSIWVAQHPEADPTKIDFLTKPIIRALDDMEVNILDIWNTTTKDKYGRSSTAATQSQQTKFRDALYDKYREKFPELDSSIIDKQVSVDIQGNSTLRAIINSGNAISEFQTKQMREDYEAINKFHGEQRDLLFDIRKNSLESVVSKSLEKTLNATFDGEKLSGVKRSDLYDQVNLTINKLKSAFPKLEPHQQATFDIAVHKFITQDGGYDGDGGWIPWDRADFPLMTIDKHSDMSNAGINELVDRLKKYLPQVRDRTPGARKKGAQLLEAKIEQILTKNPLPENFGQRNIDSRTRRRQKTRAKYDALRAQGKWYDPEAWPGLVGEALEWVKEWQTKDQTRVNSVVDRPVN